MERKQEMSQKKVTFNITYYLAFQNIASKMEELHILLTLNKEHKVEFVNVPVVGFRNDETLLGYLVRSRLSKLKENGRCELYEKKNCFLCGSISIITTFTTEALQETFEVQKGPLN